MKTHSITRLTLTSLMMALITGCGGGGGGGTPGTGLNAVSADPATQLVLSSIQQKAQSEVQETSSGDLATEGIQRNAQVLTRTVLNKP